MGERVGDVLLLAGGGWIQPGQNCCFSVTLPVTIPGKHVSTIAGVQA